MGVDKITQIRQKRIPLGEISNVQNKRRTNLSNLIKIKPCFERKKNELVKRKKYSLNEITSKSRQVDTLLSSHTTKKFAKTIPDNDPILQNKQSLTFQAINEYKSSLNWFEATNFQYIIKSDLIKEDDNIYTINKITKLNDYSFITEITNSNTTRTIILNKLRQTHSNFFDDDLTNLVNKKLKLTNDDVLSCYSKWHIYV